MPYRTKGKCVQVKRKENWVNLKCHPTRKEALAHAYKLRQVVHHD